MLLEASYYAASCIILGFKQNSFNKKFIKQFYEKPCQNTIGKQLRIHYIISLIFERFKAKDWDTLFQIVKTI